MFHPAMNTLIDSRNSRVSGPKPVHPVDAALFGLAERLATTIDAGEPSKAVSAVEARLPNRSAGLPRANRVRNLATAQSLASPKRPKKAPTIDDSLPQPVPAAAKLGRVEFTILKSRREQLEGFQDSSSQHSLAAGETRTAAKSKRAKKSRQRAGITLFGWSLMVAGAAVAAAIALWAPAWL